MSMNWGMANRLARIIKPEDGRAVMLAVDHGYFLGPTSGLEEPQKDHRAAGASRGLDHVDAGRAAYFRRP